jgi:hypothetical protein
MSQKIVLMALLMLISSAVLAKADQSYYPAKDQIKISALNPTANWVSISNIGNTPVDLAGWVLYDENDNHELFLTEPDIIKGDAGGGLMLGSQNTLTITGKNDDDFRLYNDGGEVRLYSGPVEIDGTLEDRVDYPAIAEGETYQIITPDQDQQADENSNDNVTENTNENSDEAEINSNNNKEITSDTDIADNAYYNYQIPENANSNFIISIQQENSNSNSDKDADKREKSALSDQGREVSSVSNQNGENNTLGVNENNNQSIPTFTASAPLSKSPWGWFYWLYYSWFLRRIILPLLGLWIVLFGITRFLRKKYFS